LTINEFPATSREALILSLSLLRRRSGTTTATAILGLMAGAKPIIQSSVLAALFPV
jgi:hypothetical protein